MRLALSLKAAEQLGGTRVRRLLDIELDDDAALAAGVTGPLTENVVQVWIDLPDPTRALIQVRAGDRAVAKREISIANLTSDVAARFVAIATADMVRTQTRPVRPRKPAGPRKPTAEEIELAARPAPAVSLTAGLGAAFLPSSSAALGGPSIALAFRNAYASERVFARWLGGPSDAGTMRWLEIGLGADYRFWLDPRWRVAAGAAASMAWVHLGEAIAADGVAGDQDTWSGRGGGALALERKLAGPAWLSLSFEPGVIFRGAPYVAPAGAPGRIEGAFLGGDLGRAGARVSGRAPNG